MLSTMQKSMMIDITELAIAENFGRIMGIFLLIYGLMSPVAGVIADRINRKWLIVGGAALCRVGSNLQPWDMLKPMNRFTGCVH